ncbi:hypothetical protein, partial [Ensifer aridi]|uniref:hypothetical protein n=1 Tax=Ensifer aridi TaxID=1708715 RepID=UPI00196A0285
LARSPVVAARQIEQEISTVFSSCSYLDKPELRSRCSHVPSNAVRPGTVTCDRRISPLLNID